jgi:hypothetical protein
VDSGGRYGRRGSVGEGKVQEVSARREAREEGRSEGKGAPRTDRTRLLRGASSSRSAAPPPPSIAQERSSLRAAEGVAEIRSTPTLSRTPLSPVSEARVAYYRSRNGGREALGSDPTRQRTSSCSHTPKLSSGTPLSSRRQPGRARHARARLQTLSDGAQSFCRASFSRRHGG